MSRRMIGVGVLLFFVTCSNANNGDYAVSKIPVELLKHAHAIKRMEQNTFEIISTTEAIERKKYAITILDEGGDEMASFVAHYNKLEEVKNIEGVLYDANGIELKRLKNKQIVDLSGDEGLVDEDRFKVHKFYYKSYPYTVEYEVETKINNTLFFPNWIPCRAEYFAVQQSSMSIIYPSDYVVRYKMINYDKPPTNTTTDRGKKVMSFSMTNMPAIIDEFASPNWNEMCTGVFFGPTNFEIENYKGNMTSWAEFGKFVYSLKQGRDQLPDNVKQTVHRIADGIADPKEKIAKLYEYMQQNTHYISIQLGIGSWQPFDAKYVASKAYGDCKALSNYMFSILKEVGIRSSYALVRAGANANKIMVDFPSQQFDHVILCVPMVKDTMWLECTNQTMPAGYLGNFTDDRYALLIDEDGGKLVHTPIYSMHDNLEIRRVNAVLNDDATLEIKANNSYRGLQQDMYHGMLAELSKDKLKEFLHRQFDFATYDITKFDYVENKSALPTVNESLDITVSNYASMTGKRLFIIPNVMTRSNRKLSGDTDRRYDLELGYSYQDIDSVVINLPTGYTVEAIPQDLSISNKFGHYECSVKLVGDQLIYNRNNEQFGGHFAASDYSDLVKFYDAIYKADRNKVVLVKKEQ